MRVIELGSYIAPAYAGMILAEQGHTVVKLTTRRDPTLALDRGDELWQWVNHGKSLSYDDDLSCLDDIVSLDHFDAVIDNFRPATLDRFGIDPAVLARRYDLAWVSLRPDIGERSFDVVAQARSWMEYAPWVPFYLGDTCAGLWLAFKALSMHTRGVAGHEIIYQASALQKLVEGELVIDVERDGTSIPWDIDAYTGRNDGALVTYKGETITEPVRDRAWKLSHLRHRNGRMCI